MTPGGEADGGQKSMRRTKTSPFADAKVSDELCNILIKYFCVQLVSFGSVRCRRPTKKTHSLSDEHTPNKLARCCAVHGTLVGVFKFPALEPNYRMLAESPTACDNQNLIYYCGKLRADKTKQGAQARHQLSEHPHTYSSPMNSEQHK